MAFSAIGFSVAAIRGLAGSVDFPDADVLDLRTVDEYHSRVQSKYFNRWLAAWMEALLLVVLGAKLWVIQAYGTAIPYWDQWDEANLFFKPWLEGHLTWGAWFAPHNEHRIFFTRLLDLSVLWLNRQWDPRLQMTINAFIHTGYACGLAYCLWIFTGRKHEGLICFLLMPFFALPFAAENTIHGFQSQMYFLELFSLVTLVGLGFGSPGGGWWFCGLAASVMALFTMGSGLLASLAVTGLLGLRWLKGRSLSRGGLVTLGCSLTVIVFSLVLNAGVEKHGHFQARSFGDFGDALACNLAWPFIYQPIMLFVICLPLAITVVRYFHSDCKDSRAAEFVLVLGFWGVLQAAALAYGRAYLGNSSRYMDPLSILSIASLASLFISRDNMEYRRLSRPLMGLLAMVWVGCLFCGIWQISGVPLGGGGKGNYMQSSKRTGLIEEQNVRAFIATDDPSYLVNKPPEHIPYTDAGRLMELLRNPKLLSIMSRVCRPSLKLEKDESSDALLVLNGYPPGAPKQEFTPVWGNCSNGAALTGHFVSQSLNATLPKLSVTLFCGPETDGVGIQLVEQTTGRRIELRPKITGRWHTIIVPAPRNPFRLEITDQNHNVWLAVGEISELGFLSDFALRLLNRAAGVLLAGLGLVVVLSGSSVVRGISRGNFFRGGGGLELLVLSAGLTALVWVWSGRNDGAGTGPPPAPTSSFLSSP